MSVNNCPPLHEIQAFLLLDAVDAADHDMHRHLETCESCLRSIDELLSREADQLFGSDRTARNSLATTGESLPKGFLESLRAARPQTISRDATSLDVPARLLQVGETFGHFEILAECEAGGMGVIYEALDRRSDESVALKIVNPTRLTSETRQRFLSEAQTGSKLSSEFLVPVIDFGEVEGVPWLSMPYLEGESLKSRIGRGQFFPLERILQIGTQICHGLQVIHSAGLIHRDIKPGNIWLDTTGRAMILDFGLVGHQKQGTGLTQTNQVLGSQIYMSPEQAMGHAISHRSDLYSFGTVLHELTTLVRPSGAATMSEIREQIDSKHPASQVTQELAQLMADLLCKDENGRPESAEVVLERLCKLKNMISKPQTRILSQPRLLLLLVFGCVVSFVVGWITSTAKTNQINPVPNIQPTVVGTSAVVPAIQPDPQAEEDDSARESESSEPGTQFSWPENAPPPAIIPFNAEEMQLACADFLGIDVEIVNSIGLKMRLIPNGEFQMGLAPEDAAREMSRGAYQQAQRRGELHPHRTVISKPFYAGVTEITVGQFAKVDPGDSAFDSLENPDAPKTHISWFAAVEFCNSLSEQESLNPAYSKEGNRWVMISEADGYRLPTEAEWEFLHRAGHPGLRCSHERDLPGCAWYEANSESEKKTVGLLKANGFGLHDTLGNAAEWCHDVYSSAYYGSFGSTIAVDPAGPSSGEYRIIRGASLEWYAVFIRAGFRAYDVATSGSATVGIRIVRSVQSQVSP